eukprot:366222-Chlamydomonas_euryale.AAC.2
MLGRRVGKAWVLQAVFHATAPAGVAFPLAGVTFPVAGVAFPVASVASLVTGVAFPVAGVASSVTGVAFPDAGVEYSVTGVAITCVALGLFHGTCRCCRRGTAAHTVCAAAHMVRAATHMAHAAAGCVTWPDARQPGAWAVTAQGSPKACNASKGLKRRWAASRLVKPPTGQG